VYDAPPPRAHDAEPVLEREPDDAPHLVGGARAHDCDRPLAAAVHVGRVELEVGRVGQHVLGTEQRAECGDDRMGSANFGVHRRPPAPDGRGAQRV
jgi:hypothetical protein